MMLSILDILYIVLIIFSTIIGTLLTLVLIRVLKVMGVLVEITGYYNKIKQIFVTYSKIPEIVKDKVKEHFGNN